MDSIAVEVCPCCKRPLESEFAFLEHLSAGYALIVRYVRRAGPEGIASDDLMDLMYPRGGPETGVKVLWDRVHRLNRDHLRPRGYEVVAPGGGHGTPGRYVFRVRNG